MEESTEHQDADIAPSLFSENTTLWNMNEKRRAELSRRQKYLGRMAELDLSVERYIELLETNEAEREYHGLASAKFIPGRSTLYLWKTAADNIEALSRGRGGTGRKSQIPNWVVVFVLQKLNIDPHARISSIFESLKSVAEYWDWYVPAQCTLTRFVKAIRKTNGLQDMLRKVQTRRYFSKYEMAIRHHYSHSNHIWETDATRLKIKVRQNGKSEAIWLLLTVDCFSGCIMGWTLVIGDPTANDQIRHLRECLLPKRNGGWGGKPVILQSDNGKIYTCEVLSATCADLGIILRQSPPYCPAYNGAIERMNDIFKARMEDKYVEFVKTYYRHSVRKQKENEELFLGTAESLKKNVERCFHEICTQAPRDARKTSRLEAWCAGLRSEKDGEIDEIKVRQSCLYHARLPATREGVLVRGVRFTDPILRYWNSGKILVRYNFDGEPEYVVAMLGEDAVRLFRNTDEDATLVERTKNGRWQDREQLRGINETLQKGALDSMHLHTPGTADARIELQTARAETIEHSPTSKIRIPAITKVQIRTDY